ncbi:Tph3p NDAI_0C02850 [Naumovozyma dairenensis CBS 421]|uniref:Skg3/CAF120-like PH-like domain-containing protein n=1 Tax=Naumovozyma dairenensis (strain ATCC 10597 / BCRC 20456 / CBS 421 / NBRC 0211 / NRRL Y-12639) TaxID=1071378 RepID=G0W834_NAUDC|nr:hypothetical protein NDAI_0C02850 [Naumovozyma dairenensis CBS 421]CCD23945.1 hypothetical protein NDAI_0C02850 [Naumovozyma dairenensis CBS 421]
MKFLDSLKKPIVIKRRADSNHPSSIITSSSSSIFSDHAMTPPQRTPANILKELQPTLLKSVLPILVLLNAQSSKKYFEWNNTSDTKINSKWNLVTSGNTSETLPLVTIILTGTKLRIITSSRKRELTIDLLKQNIELFPTLLEFKNNDFSLSCSSPDALLTLYRFCLLSIFEHFSIFKSLTGTLTSVLGLRMFDMHIILNTQFNFKDWCEIYIEGEGWVKAWCVVKKKKNGNSEIRFYKNNNSLATKNLICFISPEKASIQDIMFYNDKNTEIIGDDDDDVCVGNTSKFQDIHSFLNQLRTIKVIGNICFLNNDGGTSSKNSSRSSSISNMSQIDGTNVSSPPKRKMFSPSNKGHARSSSHVSSMTMRSSKSIKDTDYTINSSGLLIRPTPHNGVFHLEALIRVIIPMMDVMKLYGRPMRFKNARNDPDSLMFGLPRLPNIDYLAKEEIDSFLSEKNPEIDADEAIEDTKTSALKLLGKVLFDNLSRNENRDTELLFTRLSDLSINQPNEGFNVVSAEKNGLSKESVYTLAPCSQVV